jgi:hypothetical protein
MPFPKGYGSLFTRVRGRTFPKVLYPVRAQALSGSFTSPSEPTRTAKGNCPIVATGARRRLPADPASCRLQAIRARFSRDLQASTQALPCGLSFTHSVNRRTPGWSLSASTES